MLVSILSFIDVTADRDDHQLFIHFSVSQFIELTRDRHFHIQMLQF